MADIDQRIVQMEFDNKQFERNVAQSIKTLDDLRESLKLDEASESIRNLDKKFAEVDFDKMEAGISRISDSFTLFGGIGEKVLDSVENKVISVAKNLTGLLTGFNDMQAGMGKYELETKSVQTIKNATGKSVEEVESVLKKLMKYTDETSYDFAQMASEIGKFTSVGIDLQVAEQAMEGIANWAAKSGAGKTEANRAMYNISQAMGSGAMLVKDWMSIENANMATKEFKETAIETAIELGVLQKKAEGVGAIVTKNKKGQISETTVDYKTFRETLKDKWLTSEVLTATLEKYGDQTTEFGLAAFHAAQEALTLKDAIDAVKDTVSSGWMETMQLLFGNLDEAKKLWTDLATRMQEFAQIFSTERNELLENWHNLGGYQAAIEALMNLWETLENIVLGVKEALEAVFHPIWAEDLIDFTEKIRDGTAALKDFFAIDKYETSEELEEIFETTVDYARMLSDTLKSGDTGTAVETLQQQLIGAGYKLDIEQEKGIYGPKTKAAIQKLQKNLGVKVTGSWDAATRAAAMAKEVFVQTEEHSYDVEEQVSTLSKPMSRIQEIIKGIASAAKMVLSVLKGAFDIVTKFLTIFKPVIDLAARFGAMFGMMFKNLADDLSQGGAIQKAVDGITSSFGPLVNAIQTVTQFFHDFINAYAAALYSTRRKNTFGNFFIFLLNYLKQNTILGPVVAVIENIIGVVINLGSRILNIVMNIVDKIGTVIGNLLGMTPDGETSGIATFFITIYNIAMMAAQGLTTVVDIVGGLLSTGISVILNNAGPIIQAFSTTVIGLLQSLIAYLPNVIPMLTQVTPIILAIVGAFLLWHKTTNSTIGAVSNKWKIFIGLLGFFAAVANRDRIVGFFNGLGEAIKKLPHGEQFIGWLQGVVAHLKNFFAWVPKISFIDNIKHKFETIHTFLSNVIANIIGILKGFGNSIVTLFSPNTEAEKNMTFFERFISRIQPFLNWLTGIRDKIAEAWKSIFGGGEATQGKQGKSILEGMLNGVKGAFGALAGVASKIINSDVINTIIKGIFAVAALKFASGFATLGEHMEQTVKALRGDADPKDTLGTTALKFAGAVAIIAASLALLSKLDFQVDEKTGVINALQGYMDIVLVTATAIAALRLIGRKLPKSKDDDDLNIAKTIFKIAASAAVLGAGLLLIEAALSNKNAPGAITLLIGIVVLLGGLQVALAVVAAKSGSGKAQSAVSGIYDLCKGVLMIAISIAALTATMRLFDAGKMWGSFAILALVIAELGALMFGLNAVTANSSHDSIQTSVYGIQAMCKGLLMIAASIWLLTGTISKHGGAAFGAFMMVEAILVELGVLIYLLHQMTSNNKEAEGKSRTSFGGILSMCLGLLLVVASIGMLSDTIAKNGGLTALGAFAMVEVMLVTLGSVAILVAKYSKDSKFTKSVGQALPIAAFMAGVIFLVQSLTDTVKAMKGTDPWSIVALMAGLAIIMGEALLYTKMIADLDASKIKWSTMLAMFVPMAAMFLGACLLAEAIGKASALIKDIEPDQLFAFMSGLSVAIVAIGLVLGGLTALSKAGIGAGAYVDVAIGIAGFLIALGLGLSVFINLGVDAINRATLCLQIMGTRMKLFSESVSQMDWDAVAKVTDFVSNTLVTMITNILILRFEEALNQMIKLTKIGAQFKLYADNISGISNGIESNSKAAIKMVEDAQLMVNKVASIALPPLLANHQFAGLGAQIKQYGNQLLGVQTSGLQNALDIANNAKEVSDIIGQIGITGDINTALTEFGAAIKLYYMALAGAGTDENGNPIQTEGSLDIDSEQLKKIMEGLAGAIPEDSIAEIQSFAEGQDHDMTTVALGIAALGTALKSYSEDIGGLKSDEVTAANGVLDTVGDLYTKLNDSKLQDSEGYLGDLNKDDALSHFSTNLELLGGALDTYKTKIGGINPTEVETANTVIDKVKGLNEYLNSESDNYVDIEGMSASIPEKNEIEIFASQLVTLASGIKDYADAAKDAKITDIWKANSIVLAVLGIKDKLPEEGGFKSFFEGTKDLAAFASDIATLGSNLKTYKEKINDVHFTDDDIKTIDGVVKLATAFSKLGRSGGLEGLLGGNFSWANFSSGLGQLGEDITEFKEKTKEYTTDGMDDVFATIDRIVGWVDKAKSIRLDMGANEGVHNVFELISSGISQMFSDLAALPEATEGGFLGIGGTNIYEKVKNMGVEFIRTVSLGISEDDPETGAVPFALKTVMENAITFAMNYRTGFEQTGKYLCEGLMLGIQEKLDEIKKTAEALGNAIIDPVIEKTEVHSPSRKFEWIGQMCALGLMNGFDKYSYLVENASEVMATKSVDAIMAAYKSDKLADVTNGALEAISNILIKGHDSKTKYTKEELSFVKQILRETGYLAAEDYNDIDKIKSAVVLFKKEVLGVEDAIGKWNYSDSTKLYNAILYGAVSDSRVKALENQNDSLNQLGENASIVQRQYAKAAEVIAKSTDNVTESMDTLYTAVLKNYKRGGLFKLLQLEDTGTAVINLQKVLSNRGFLSDLGDEAGVFGEKTETALKELQKSLDIAQSGVWDEVTMKSLAEARAIEKDYINKEMEKQLNRAIITGDQSYFNRGGTVNLNNRPSVSSQKLADMGYEVDESGIATLFSHSYTVTNGDREIGIVLTPILPNGDVLEADTLNKVIESLTIDEQGRLVLPNDAYAGFQLDDILVSSLDMGNISKDLHRYYLDQFGETLHQAQSVLDVGSFIPNEKQSKETAKQKKKSVTPDSKEIEKNYKELVDTATELGLFGKYLRFGQTSDTVTELQKLLQSNRYLKNNFDMAGHFGGSTQNALKHLQKDLGVDQTGIWDQNTAEVYLYQKAIDKATQAAEDIAAEVEKVSDNTAEATKKAKEFTYTLTKEEQYNISQADDPKALEDMIRRSKQAAWIEQNYGDSLGTNFLENLYEGVDRYGNENMFNLSVGGGSIPGIDLSGFQTQFQNMIGCVFTGEGGLFSEGGGIFNGIKNMFVGEGGLFSEGGGILDGLKTMFTGEDGLLGSLKGIFTGDDSIFGGENGIFSKITGFFTGEDNIFTKEGGIGSLIGDIFTGENGLFAKGGSIVEGIKGIFSTDNENGLFSTVGQFFSNIFTNQEGENSIFNGITGMFSKIFSTDEGGIFSTVKGFISSLFTETGEGSLLSTITSTITGALTNDESVIEVPIRPVLSISDDNGNLISQDGYTYSLKAPENLTATLSSDAVTTISASSAANEAAINELNKALGLKVDATNDALDGVGKKLNITNSNLAKLGTMNVYLDGDRVAGYVAPKIDRLLGLTARKVGRLMEQ